MEDCREKNSLKKHVQDILLLLEITREIFPLSKEIGMGVEEGIVLFAETTQVKEKLLWKLTQLGVVNCTSNRQIRENVRNNRINLYVEKQYDPAEKIYNFLSSGECLSVVLTSGILPKYAQGGNLLVFNGETSSEMISEKFLREIKQFREYVHKHPSIVLRELRLLKKSEAFRQNTVNDSCMQKTLKASGEIWRTFLIEEHDEEESNMVRQRLWDSVNAFTELAEEYESVENVADAVGKMLRMYVKKHDEIGICDVTDIDLEMTEKIQEKKAILQNSEFYFIPEELLKKACQPLLGAISFLTIKKELNSAGYLLKNEGTVENYTTKLVITNSCGFVYRPRFLKLRKELIESVRTLGFSESNKEGGGLCISENFKEETV